MYYAMLMFKGNQAEYLYIMYMCVQ